MITKLRDFFIGILDEYYSTEHKGLKLFWIFLLASLIGAVVEILFVRVTAGLWMSRSSLLYGQFSVVWGLGATLMTILLHRLTEETTAIFLSAERSWAAPMNISAAFWARCCSA